ncbi:MAG: (Fe-S)-binding protein, partial [bacterium]|nr:(Fe-S)-binding protein [bacterium]
ERFAAQCPPGDRFKFEAYFASGRNELARRVIEGQQEFTERFRHILYTCTACGACEQWCEATQGLYPLKIIMALRNHYVSQGGELMPGSQKIVDSISANHNRLNRNNRDRKIWMNEEDQDHEKPDLIYFVGCRSSFKRKEIAKNTYELLSKKLGFKVGLLKEERCCGQPLIDLGEEDAAMEMMRHNLAEIKATGVKRILTSCAECFNVLSNVEKYGFEKDFEVVHLGQLLAESLPFEKLKLDQKITATYHDP